MGKERNVLVSHPKNSTFYLQNVQKLYDELTVEKKEKILVPEHSSIKFNHIDFMYAKDIKELLYPRMFQVIEDLSE